MQGILLGLSDVFDLVLRACQFFIVIAAILSWVGADPYNPIVRAIRGGTEPIFAWLRRRMPFLVQGSIDFSPLAAILICVFLQKALVYNLRILAARF
jgi:YggT family protein